MFLPLKRIFLSFIFILFYLSGYTQILITGTILNPEKQPLEFANVVLQDSVNQKLITGTTSDQDGKFKLEISEGGTYQLTITYLIFSEWKQHFTVNESIELGEVVMRKSSTTLDEVVVSATRNTLERKADKLILNVGSSPLKSGYDGMEILQRTPHIWIENNGGILMRNESATVLINGRKLNLKGADLANYIRNLESENIKRIEIQTNLSADSDGESSGGVINIILKKKPVGFRARLRANHTFKGAGFYQTNASINTSYGAQKWNIYGNYNFRKGENEVRTDSEIFYNISQNYLSTNRISLDTSQRHSCRLGFVMEPVRKHLFGMEIYGSHSLLQFDNSSVVQMSNANDILDQGLTIFKGETDNNLFNATINYTWYLDSLNSKLQFFGDYTEQGLFKNSFADSAYELAYYQDTLERNDSDAKTNIYALQTDWIQNFDKGLRLQTGLKWVATERENSLLSEYFADAAWVANNRTTDFNYNERILAGYALLSKQLDAKHFIRVGLRLENTNLERIDILNDTINAQNYNDWLPDFFLSRTLGKKESLAFSYSKKIRRPSFSLLNNDVRKINDFRYELGNPDLAPESIHKFDLSLNQAKQSWSVFYVLNTDAVNGIFFLEDDISYYKKINSGVQKQMGVEYNRFGNLTKWWYVKALGTVYHRKFTNEAGEDQFKRTTTYLSLSNIFKIDKTTSIDLSGSYTSPRADAFYLAAARYRVNLMLQKTFFEKKLSCRLYLTDVFNTLIFENERVFTDFKTTNSGKPRTRTLRLWVSYNFATQHKVDKRRNKSDSGARRRL